MKIKLLLLILILTTTHSYGQIKFEKGYFINNENQRIDCLIKNYDWANTPKEIVYKSSENAAVEKGTIATVKEFGIIGISKFVRAEVKIDRSPTALSGLSGLRNPIWSEEKLFLQVLIMGKASLYQYRENNFERYFFSVSDTIIQQLIYKEYRVDPKNFADIPSYKFDNNVAYNNDFRQQLWKDVKSENITISYYENINYNRKELEACFRQFNGPSGPSQEVINDENKNRDLFFLKLTPGINYSSVAIVLSNNGITETYSDKGFFCRFGIEAGFVLPFNKNKWLVLFEPSYQYFKASSENISVNFSTVEFPLGVRYHFFLNDNIKMFVNGFYVPGIKLYLNQEYKQTIDIGLGPYVTSSDISCLYCFALGGGIDCYKFSLEFRYYPKCEMLSDYFEHSSSYQRIALIAGYQIFKIKHK
jgi:hypothetical protein